MKVKCINVMCDKLLIFGKVYEVVEEFLNFYIIDVENEGSFIFLKEHFEPVKEEGFNAQNTTINIAGINFSCKDTPCMFATENWNVKEDKMEEVEMKVRYIENFTNVKLTKYKIYDVLTECEEYFTIINDDGESQKYAKHYFLIVNNDETNKVMLVRKLEDLDGLENGMGLKLHWVINKDKIEMNFGEIRMFYWNKFDLEKLGLEGVFNQIKSMGFKFEYKPLRSLEEVMEEISNLNNKRSFDKNKMHNYYVCFDRDNGRYDINFCNSFEIIGLAFMRKETAQKYADELNEILKNN
ncbi:MAG: hypothetical protein ACRC7R_01495 [Sarcina sp.]